MTEDTTGNSMPDDAAAEKGVFDSSDSFFDALDNEVSGAVLDQDTSGEVQQESNEPIAEQATQQNVDPAQASGNDTTDWEKRYKDSSREAQRLNAELQEFQPIKPLVDYMKRDSGLVDTIRGYLQNGGKTPSSIQDNLNLPEDFVFDGHEAVTDTNSESAKVLNQMVDGTVQRRVNNMLQKEKEENAKIAAKNAQIEKAKEFMERNNMSQEDFANMLQKVKEKGFSYDDMHYLVNRDKVAQNVATSTKNEMLGQMKNARQIPTSQGGTNSSPAPTKSVDDGIFDALLGADGGLDDLFS
tara:strand:+ start:8510 stop:9403 length:894 start_codon:yes stop_codon:yes gene_type:complete